MPGAALLRPVGMDWYSASAALLGRDAPRIVLDEDGVVLLTNGQAEALLLHAAEELVGARIDDVCEPQDPPTVAWPCAGAPRLRTMLDIVGIPGASARLLTVLESQEVGPPLPGDVVEYDIDCGVATFGRLRRLRRRDELRRFWGRDAPHCHHVLHGRASPCRGCPVLRQEHGSFAEERHVEIVGVDRESVSVSLRSRPMPPRLLEAVRALRLREMAEAYALSPRQLGVLERITAGCTPSETARALGISKRTVKQHQTSALTKLGLGSPADLLRRLADLGGAPL